MDKSIDCTACVEVERQALQKFRYDDGMVCNNGIVSQSHFGVTAFDFCDRNVRHLATRSACCGHNDQFFLFDKRYFAVECIEYII